MKNLYALLIAVLFVGFVHGQATKTIQDNGNGTGTVTWSNDTTYILDGFVFVNSGQTLTIEAGTVVKGKPGQTTDASALVVARGGKIMAQGTADAPIIFTAEADDVTNPFDIPENTTGLWGGVIILGNAQLNSSPGESAIEGIPTTETRGLYGAIDTNGDTIPDSWNDFDNSGVFSYCSIRYGGTDIGAGNEINGLTLGGVGAGTKVDHVEVMFNFDDGVEFFGGTVNTSHMITAFCGDDAFDYDEGFRGKGQFWVVIQSDSAGSDRGGEFDGGTDPELGQPFATPTIYNATFIGRAQAANTGSRAMTIRDNAGGYFYNSIFYDYGRGVDVEILGNSDDSYKMYQDGFLKLENNLFWNVAGNDPSKVFTITAASFGGISLPDSTATVDAAKADMQAYFVGGGNDVANPQFYSIGREAGTGELDPRPMPGSAAYSNLASYPNDNFIKTVNYKGAFSSSSDLWAKGWTLLDEMGYLPDFTPGTVTVTDNGSGTGTTTWTSNNTYILDGFVFVNSGDTLNIEAGTVIKGKPGQTTEASALVVARGAYINAIGTREDPIIFTAEADDVTNPFDIPLNTTGLWGGLIILGNAQLNSSPGESAIEGIPTTEIRGLYGAIDTNGDTIPDSWDDNDNSGHLSYISIRHGGTDIGAGNEINGMTFGGVGAGTTVDHIEVIFNFDDGYEFFGGTVNTKNLIAAYCGDDAFDYDEGFRGKGQFWVVFQSDSAGSDRGGEFDGGTDPETGQPFAIPTIYNATFIGRSGTGSSRAMTIRDNAGGIFRNSIFAEYGRGVDIEILGNSDDSYKMYQDGLLKLENNIFWNIAGNDASKQFTITAASFGGISLPDSTATVDAAKTDVAAYFGTANNTVADPLFPSLSWINNEQLDPRPSNQGPAYQNLAALPTGDDFFTVVDYKGAFSNSTDLWATQWTLMDALGYFPLGNTLTAIDKDLEILTAITVYPNPNNGMFNIRIQDAKPEAVSLVIFDMMGKVVFDQQVRPVDGNVETEVDLSQMPAGMYIMRATQVQNVIGVSRIIKQ
ncbi:MAG: T9SS type A sorting domain-containing protein [Bacteroidia bacterium]